MLLQFALVKDALPYVVNRIRGKALLLEEPV
jgi:hypothetical protein